jgi:hypothetical protein
MWRTCIENVLRRKTYWRILFLQATDSSTTISSAGSEILLLTQGRHSPRIWFHLLYTSVTGEAFIPREGENGWNPTWLRKLCRGSLHKMKILGTRAEMVQALISNFLKYEAKGTRLNLRIRSLLRTSHTQMTVWFTFEGSCGQLIPEVYKNGAHHGGR